MPNVELEYFHRKHLKTYIDFAEREWEKYCHQSSENYINWLYNENPCPRNSKENFVLAFYEGKVIGCVHKMGLMWKVKGRVEYIPAVHNLMVARNHRRKGCGILLLKHSFVGENHALVPGVIKDQKNIYKFFRCQKINSSWYRKILSPLGGAYYLTVKKLFDRSAPSAFFNANDLNKSKSLNASFKTTVEPNDRVIGKVISSLNKMSTSMVFPYWTIEQFRWRFFHPLGPRHLMIYKESDHDIKDFVILSLGPKKGLNIARVIEMEASSLESLDTLMQQAEILTKLFGGHILLNFSCSSKLNELLVKLKYKLIKNQPDTYFYYKNKKDVFHSFSFNGAAGDFGFESIP